MPKHLVLSGIGPDRPGIAKAISEAAYQAGCGIEDSRMAVLGGEFAILVLVSGESGSIDAFIERKAELEQETGLTLCVRETSLEHAAHMEKGIFYKLHVVGMDRTGIVYRLTNLLAREGINIENLETTAHHAPVTGTPMFRMELIAEVPSSVNVRHLRSELASICDEMNVDFTLEAQP